MEAGEDRREAISQCAGHFVGGGVVSVSIELPEDKEEDMGRLAEIRDAQILRDACGLLETRDKDSAPWVSVDELLQEVHRVNKKRKGDPYWAAGLKASQLGVMLAKAGIKADRIPVGGTRVRVYLAEDLVGYVGKQSSGGK